MSPIIDLQRRIREAGRIRIGEQIDTGRRYDRGPRKGEPIMRPAKLARFRLTSQDQRAVDAAAAVFGGTPRPWANAPSGEQWELYTERAALDVVVPPAGMTFSQWYETWSGGGCLKRCDGRWETVNDKACSCDPDERECDAHTRLSVILPDLPGLGVWRLDTSGYNAAVELAGAVEVCEMAAARGQMLPARLLLEQRVKRVIVRGRPETRKFAVPVLDVEIPLAAFGRGADPVTGEIGPGPRSVPSFTPVPAELAAPAPTIAEQVAAKRPEPRPRKNAAAPIPATGLKPRTAAQATTVEAKAIEQDPGPQEDEPPEDSATATPAGPLLITAIHRANLKDAFDRLSDETAPIVVHNARAMSPPLHDFDSPDLTADEAEEWVLLIRMGMARDAMVAGGFDWNDETLRHGVVGDATDGETSSSRRLTKEQLNKVLDYCATFRNTTETKPPARAGVPLHVDGCALDPDHAGECAPTRDQE